MRRTLFLLGLVGMLCLASGQDRMADLAAHQAMVDSRPVWTACGAGLDCGFSGITMA